LAWEKKGKGHRGVRGPARCRGLAECGAHIDRQIIIIINVIRYPHFSLLPLPLPLLLPLPLPLVLAPWLVL